MDSRPQDVQTFDASGKEGFKGRSSQHRSRGGRSGCAGVDGLSMTRIPQEVLDAGYRSLVHVEGWGLGCCFHHVASEKLGDGSILHRLVTPKTRKQYSTTRNLIYTRKNSPNDA